MMKIPSMHLNSQKQFSYIYNKTEQSNSIIKKYVEEEKNTDDSMINLKQAKSSALTYILKGNFIKVYVVENGITKQCLKSIHLKDASPDILAQVENISFIDIITILDMQNDEKKQSKEENIHQNKGLIEYSKHEDVSCSTFCHIKD